MVETRASTCKIPSCSLSHSGLENMYSVLYFVIHLHTTHYYYYYKQTSTSGNTGKFNNQTDQQQESTILDGHLES